MPNQPKSPPVKEEVTADVKSTSGFQVEFREGYYYCMSTFQAIAHLPLPTSSIRLTFSFPVSILIATVTSVPENCTEVKVGDRVLEINGVQAFNFNNTASANSLFDTVCLLYISKEELEKKANGGKSDDDSSISSEDIAEKRRGRRSMLEEESRRIGEMRRSFRNMGELLKKQQREEKEFRRAEIEIRRMERMDRERQRKQRSTSLPPTRPSLASTVASKRPPAPLIAAMTTPSGKNRKSIPKPTPQAFSSSPLVSRRSLTKSSSTKSVTRQQPSPASSSSSRRSTSNGSGTQLGTKPLPPPERKGRSMMRGKRGTIGSFSPGATRRVSQEGWLKVAANHRKNG
eukprot:scaffold4891_cov140-Cylindrotheca_fusiformis.AAC.12